MASLKLGDCLELMKDIPTGSVDMVLCDLPYGTTMCKWDVCIPLEPLWEQYHRVCKKNAVIVLFGGEPFTSKLIISNITNFTEKLTWVKHKPSNIGNAKIRHLKYSEDIVVFSKGKHTYNPQMQPRLSNRIREAQKGNSKQWRTVGNNGSEVCFGTLYKPKDWNCYSADKKYPSNVLNFPAVVSNSKEKCLHPTQKPVALLEYLIKTYSNEGETVLDNTMGSGSTGVACVNTGRDFFGIEKDETYFDIAQKRIAEAEKERELFLIKNAV